jgi:transcriptional regulator with XRE-family HTH domain
MPTLLELRKAVGRSRARVAADLEMSERHLYRLEAHKVPLRHVLALAFSRYYDVPVTEIAEAEEAAA